MTLRLYDTKTRAVHPVEPIRPGSVGVYVCGPTVQAAPHVGHLRSAVALDVLHRWLLERGEQVTFVRNVTDVDDKIIHDAAHNDEPWWALSARMTHAFDDAYDAVQVLRPTIDPRVTGHLPQIIALIGRIIDRGHAYESGGDVYLAVRTAEGYGALSGQSLDALQVSDKTVAHGHSGAKRDPLDFALWKAAKEGEPSWPSPWGPGRPGWHIECSAIAREHLGAGFDVQGGGSDLVFPHHEMSAVQSAALTHDDTFARHYVHQAMVGFEGALLGMGGPSFPMADHYNHIHVGFHPLFGSNTKLGRQLDSVLKPAQWIKLIDRIGDFVLERACVALSGAGLKKAAG